MVILEEKNTKSDFNIVLKKMVCKLEKHTINYTFKIKSM